MTRLVAAARGLLCVKNRVALLVALYMLASLLALSLVVFQQARRQVLLEAKQIALGALDELAKSCHGSWDPALPPERNQRLLEASGIRARLERTPRIAYAAFQDLSGQRRFSLLREPDYEWMLRRTNVKPPQRRMLDITGRSIRVFAPDPDNVVTELLGEVKGKDGRVLGIARVGVQQSSLTPRGFLEQAAGTLALAIALATLAGLALMFFILGLLERPVMRLYHRARCLLSSHGHAPAAEGGGRRDGIVLLGQQFDGIERLLECLKANRSQMMANLSHEFRTPLQVIHGYIRLLSQGEAGPVTPEMREILRIIEDNTLRFQGFIENVLDWALIEERRLSIDARPFAVEPLVESILELFREQAREHGVGLVADVSGRARAIGDPSRTYQIVINLLTNSLKFTPRGGTICVGCRDVDSWVEIFVADTGPGIPQEHRDKVFDAFYQVPQAPRLRGHHGLGLGLTLCKRFAEFQGGRMRIEPNSGRGTRIVLALPLGSAA